MLSRLLKALLAAGCLAGFAGSAQAEESVSDSSGVLTGLSSTALDGYVNTSAYWIFAQGAWDSGGINCPDLSALSMKSAAESARAGGQPFASLPPLPTSADSPMIVPEPTTWTVLVLGAGIVMSALRARRNQRVL